MPLFVLALLDGEGERDRVGGTARERKRRHGEKAVFVRARGVSAVVIREIMWVYQER